MQKSISAKLPLVLTLTAAAVLTGCAITPQPLTVPEQADLLSADRLRAEHNVEPIGAVLKLDEAIARGLKYNLEYRTKLMREAIAMGASQLSNYDMLPKVVANAGYAYRNNSFITSATGAYDGTPSLSQPFITSERSYGTAGISLNWSVLDFGVSYYEAQANADKVLVAAQERRKSMHSLEQDIITAYLRAAAAQKLRDQILNARAQGQIALDNSRQASKDGLRSILEELRYQRALMENVKLLETINQELSTAQVELNHLINAPANSSYALVDPDEITLPSDYSSANVDDLLARALVSNADLVHSIYDARIAVQETKKSLLKLLPNLNFATNPQLTNNSYWINKHWTDGSVSVSYNLWNVLTAPTAKRLAEQNQDLAQQKRMAAQMAVITQVYIARIQLASSMNVYQRSVDIDKVDRQILALTASKAAQGAASQAELVAADTAAIVSKLRRYQAMAQYFTASEKLRSTLGLEANFPSVSQSSLAELTVAVQDSVNSWNLGKLPSLDQAAPVAKH